MSDINNEIIDYLKLEKQVRLDGLKMMDKSAEIPQRLLKEVSIFDRWIEHLANDTNTGDSGLHLQRVSGSIFTEHEIQLIHFAILNFPEQKLSKRTNGHKEMQRLADKVLKLL